jgi:hypothetical protein
MLRTNFLDFLHSQSEQTPNMLLMRFHQSIEQPLTSFVGARRFAIICELVVVEKNVVLQYSHQGVALDLPTPSHWEKLAC